MTSKPQLVSIPNEEFWKQIQAMFPGIPKKCRSLTIRMAAGEAVTMECEAYAEVNLGDPQLITRQYRLVEEPHGPV